LEVGTVKYPTASELAESLHAVKSGDGWMAKCLTHSEDTPSLHISAAKNGGPPLLHDFGGCTQEQIIGELISRGLWPAPNSQRGVTVESFAEYKHLPAAFLKERGVKNMAGRYGHPNVAFTYYLADGQVSPRYRIRYALSGENGKKRFCWNTDKKDPICAYGLSWFKHEGSALFVEGESDVLTSLFHSINNIGFPGVSTVARLLHKPMVKGLDQIVISQEPEKAGGVFRNSIIKKLRSFDFTGEVRAIQWSGEIKDISGLHLQCGGDHERFHTEYARLLSSAEVVDLKAAPDKAGSPEEIFTDLNRKWAVLDFEPGFVIRLADGKVVNTKRFRDDTSSIQIFDEKGRKQNAGWSWLNSPAPGRVKKEIFLPHPLGVSAAPDFTEIYEGERCYNHWRGWPASCAEAIDNDAIRAYFAVRDWLFEGQPEVVEWLERWIAHKLLNPIIKQPNIPILIGPQGSGKDSLARFYAGMFGAHGDHIPGTRLTSRFNSFMGHKLFLNISELEDASPQFFKDIISNKVELIERKFVDVQTGSSYLQFFATTNERVPYLMKADDRRGGIFRVCPGKDKYAARIDTRLIAELEKLITAPQSYAGVYPYFTSLSLNGYNPFAEPVHTSDKDDLIRQHRSDPEQFICDVIENPDDYWVNRDRTALSCDLATVVDFAYLPDAPAPLAKMLDDDKRGLTTIGKWLAEVLERGTVNNGKPVRTCLGLKRLWPVRNREKWYGAAVDEIVQHFNHWHTTKQARAEAFLYEVLADGELHDYDKLVDHAAERGISKNALWQVKDRIGVKAKKHPYSDRYDWYLAVG
jgi:hypothetical protein